MSIEYVDSIGEHYTIVKMYRLKVYIMNRCIASLSKSKKKHHTRLRIPRKIPQTYLTVV